MLMKPQIFLETKDSFKVYARVRPLTQNDQKLQTSRQFFSHDQTNICVKSRNFEQSFSFDQVFSSKAQQQQIYDSVTKGIIENAFGGINGSIFCYGQTASGKTHTIVGDYGSQVLQNEGLLPRILKQVIIQKDKMVDDIKSSNLDIRIKISMIEIYNEKIFDLLDLSKKDLRLRQNKKQGVFVENVTETYIKSVEEAMKFVFSGLENRTSGKTNQNTFSSRSHMIFCISIVETDFEKKEAKSAKITLIDLAGSERLAKTGVEGKMLLQTKKINLSLSTLGKVINGLSEPNKKHIPYRDSKLTRLLKESIGGNCLTRLIINLSPSIQNQSETISALRFGSTAKLIKNKPRVNKQYTVEELLILLEKAQIKIKQLTKFIQEFQKSRGNQVPLPKDYFDLRQKAAEHISLHLVDYNDAESDDRVSLESSSKVSSVHETSQYLSNEGSGVFSHLGIDADTESPVGKKTHRTSVITSCKSMKLLPFTYSPDIKNENLKDENEDNLYRTLRVSQFVQNQEDERSNINYRQSLKKMESFHEEDLNNILGEQFMLKKTNSISMDQNIDFSTNYIHESLSKIREKCLKRMESNLIDLKNEQDNKVPIHKFDQQKKLEKINKLSIIPCYSMNHQIEKLQKNNFDIRFTQDSSSCSQQPYGDQNQTAKLQFYKQLFLKKIEKQLKGKMNLFRKQKSKKKSEKQTCMKTLRNLKQQCSNHPLDSN